MSSAKGTVLLLLLSITAMGQSGPFGFEQGMTRSEVIAAVGAKAVVPDVLPGDFLLVRVAPKPDPAFEDYLLLISPTDGLLRVIAVGRVIRSADDGTELKAAYAAMVAKITADFGDPTSRVDECKGKGPLCVRADNWMLSLFGSQRSLASMWEVAVPTKAMREARVRWIGVRTQAASVNSGSVICDFELEGLEKYVAAHQQAPPSVRRENRQETGQ